MKNLHQWKKSSCRNVQISFLFQSKVLSFYILYFYFCISIHTAHGWFQSSYQICWLQNRGTSEGTLYLLIHWTSCRHVFIVLH